MGNTRSSYLWYYAICTTRCTDNMHGIGRFNRIFSSGRRRNYQTSSIPSCSAPMSFVFERKKKTMPSPYEIWLLSNNSMAFWIRYEKPFFFIFVFFFQKSIIRLYIERIVWDKGHFRFYLIYRKPIAASQTFLFSHQRDNNNIYLRKEYKKKKLWDCLITD